MLSGAKACQSCRSRQGQTSIYLQNSAAIFNHFLERGLLASQPASQPVRVNQLYFHENMKIRIFKFSYFHIFIHSWIFPSWRPSTVRPPSVHRPSVRPFFVRPPARASGTKVLASQPASRQGKSAIFMDFFVRPSVHRPSTVRPSVRPFRHGVHQTRRTGKLCRVLPILPNRRFLL